MTKHQGLFARTQNTFQRHILRTSCLALACLAWSPTTQAQENTNTNATKVSPLPGAGAAVGINLEGVVYPHKVHFHGFTSQGQALQMAYMDVAPTGPANGHTVLLFHGKNFNGAYWASTIDDLTQAGFHVVVPDQIGFGKSTKPGFYHYSFQQLVQNTKGLLDALGVERCIVLGHSMGGMVASRFAIDLPERTERLVLVNPIGLEDWKTFGVPYPGVDSWYQSELNKTAAKIKNYQLQSYYDGQWSEAYQPWVDLLAAPLQSPDYPRLAWNQALTYDMIFTQPVVYEFSEIQAKTLLIIGTRDRTALGKNLVPDDVAAQMGLYENLGKQTQQAIPDAELIELNDLGHLPHIEAHERYKNALIPWLTNTFK